MSVRVISPALYAFLLLTRIVFAVPISVTFTGQTIDSLYRDRSSNLQLTAAGSH